MASTQLRFKTNINCSGCINAVKPHLDNTQGITRWELDTNVADKILTLEAEDITEQQVVDIVTKAGYKIEPIQD